MSIIFIAGFFLDFIEVIFIHVPVLAPIMISMGVDPLWLAVLIAVNLQTSFLTPPFGSSLFYLKGVHLLKLKQQTFIRVLFPLLLYKSSGLQLSVYSLKQLPVFYKMEN